MHLPSNTKPAVERIRSISSVFNGYLSDFLSHLLQPLYERLDRRPVHNFSLLVAAIIRFRHRQHGLLLSELGAYLLSPDKAPAGTKRISNLLGSDKWHFDHLSDWLGAQAKEQLTQWPAQPMLLHWDKSVVEKPESIHPEGLCLVRCAKDRRLARIWPGFFNPPLQRPVHVPGLLLVGPTAQGPTQQTLPLPAVLVEHLPGPGQPASSHSQITMRPSKILGAGLSTSLTGVSRRTLAKGAL